MTVPGWKPDRPAGTEATVESVGSARTRSQRISPAWTMDGEVVLLRPPRPFSIAFEGRCP